MKNIPFQYLLTTFNQPVRLYLYHIHQLYMEYLRMRQQSELMQPSIQEIIKIHGQIMEQKISITGMQQVMRMEQLFKI